jgi:hypothetical protein
MQRLPLAESRTKFEMPSVSGGANVTWSPPGYAQSVPASSSTPVALAAGTQLCAAAITLS